jgi:hypothetical protein
MPCHLISVFCTAKKHGGPDRVFQFPGGLTNYISHYDLSWFKSLLGGNSSTS